MTTLAVLFLAFLGCNGLWFCRCCKASCKNCDQAPTMTIAITSPGCPCTETAGDTLTCSFDVGINNWKWIGSVVYCNSDGQVAIFCDPVNRIWICSWGGGTCTTTSSTITSGPFSVTFVFPAGACNPFCSSEIVIVATIP